MSAPVQLVGSPDGPPRFVPELGFEVGTFTMRSDKELDHHVPLECRGDFRPHELANYKPEKTYRTDVLGRTLCYGKTAKGELCNRRAINRTPRCGFHGGRLNKLDEIVRDKEVTKNEAEEQGLSRYRQYQHGILSIDDLDDEELAQGGFRTKSGVIYRPKNVPRELLNEFQKAIFERANSELRGMVVDAAKTVGGIMKNKKNEPEVRLRAALALIERGLGKTPNVVAITQDKPFEVVFDAILHSTSNEHGTAQSGSSDPLPIESAIDAEVVDVEQSTPLGNSGIKTPEAPKQGDFSSAYQGDGSGSIIATPRDRDLHPKRYERNPAILAQSIEVKPFEYDFTDDILGKAKGIVAQDIPLERTETTDENGSTWVKLKMPERKMVTADDFE